MSFLELYHEDLIDLLNPGFRPRSAVLGAGSNNNSTGVRPERPRTASAILDGPTVREDIHGNIVWVGVKEEVVNSAEGTLR